MSKLLQLKEWVTVTDAARHLSSAFGEPVSDADIFQLALDKRLVLSVNFVNPGKGRPGDIAHYSEKELASLIDVGTFPEDLKWHHMSPEAVKELRSMGFTYIPEVCESVGYSMCMSQRLDETRLLSLTDNVARLDGVYDLPMIGAERLDIEHAYQQITGGPDVTSVVLDGALVQDATGRMFNVLDRFDEKIKPGSPSARVALERRIREEKLSGEVAAQLREEFSTARVTYQDAQKSRRPIDNYFPAAGLPDDAVFVVKTSALSKFLDDVSGRTEEKLLGTKERTTLLCVIAALCKYSDIDFRKSSKNAAVIRAIANEKLGVSIGETTIENYLKLIPDALQNRSK